MIDGYSLQSNAELYDTGANDWFVLTDSHGCHWIMTEWGEEMRNCLEMGYDIRRILADHENWPTELIHTKKEYVRRDSVLDIIDQLDGGKISREEAIEEIDSLARTD